MKKIIPLFLGFLLVTGSVNAGVGTGIFHLIFNGYKSSFFIDWFEDKTAHEKAQELQELLKKKWMAMARELCW